MPCNKVRVGSSERESAIIQERGPVQNKDQSSNKEKATRKSTMNASTNVNYNDFQNCQEEGKIKNDKGDSGIEKLKEVLSLGKENEIVEHLNKNIKPKNPEEIKILNEDAKREFNGETILHIALKFQDTNKFVEEILKHSNEFLRNKEFKAAILKVRQSCMLP